MIRLTTTRLADLTFGDRILRIGSITHERKPLTVEEPLASIAPGSPVEGVRCGALPGGVEMVLYPSQCDGQQIVFERTES